MEHYYFLDWCPTNTVPLENAILRTDGYVRQDSDNFANDDIVTLFTRLPNLIAFDYSSRLDGLVIFRITVHKNTPPQDRFEASSDISNIVKSKFGHIHEFHSYPYTNRRAKRKSDWMKMVLSRIGLFSFEAHNKLDHSLHIDPVEIEDPFNKNYIKNTGKSFKNLSEIIDPTGDDSNISQIRASKPSSKILSTERACLRLRALYAQKKEKSLLAYERKDKKSDIKRPLAFSAIAFIISILTTIYLLKIGLKTSIMLSTVASFGALMFFDTRCQSPKLDLIQRTIGYYSYANIFSKVLESIYTKAGSIKKIQYRKV